jgi:hypothetical protein
MNRIRRLAAILAGLAGALLAVAAVAPAALADPFPPRPAGTSTRRCRRPVPGSTSWSWAACPAGRSP